MEGDEEENQRERIKLRVYRGYKKKLEREEYLECNKNWYGKRLLVGLRVGASKLEIEEGRHKGIPRHERTCRICGEGVEDETHFLTVCKRYEIDRDEFFKSFENERI